MFSVLKSGIRLKSWERVYASFLTAICGFKDKSLYSFALVYNFVFLSSQKFDVQLPSLTLTLNDKQILVLYNFLFHFPSPSLVPPKLETTRDTGEPTPHRMVNDYFLLREDLVH